MKRSLDLELDVRELVKTGKARDERGQFLYPVMGEPAVMVFFGAPEALYEVITERPILLLNLLQVNKALEAFWSQFAAGMWIKVIDLLIEKAMGKYASEIYPFIAVEKHLYERSRQGMKDTSTLVVPFIGYEEPEPESVLHEFDINYITTLHSPVKPIFYVAYYDEMTRLYMDLMRKIEPLRGMDTHALYPTIIRRYINMPSRFPRRHVAFFSDCFLVAITGTTTTTTNELFTHGYDVEAMRSDLRLITESLLYQVAAMESSLGHEAQALALQLTSLLDKGMVPEKPLLIKLDKNVVAPYRILLYDSEQGLVKTEQEQKAFLIELLRTHNEYEEKEVLIEKYGCSICGRETEQVDPLSMRAFCSEACHSFSPLK